MRRSNKLSYKSDCFGNFRVRKIAIIFQQTYNFSSCRTNFINFVVVNL
jgi:hypothetical protein